MIREQLLRKSSIGIGVRLESLEYSTIINHPSQKPIYSKLSSLTPF